LSPQLTVLQSFPAPKPTTNPYIVMLSQSLSETDGLRVKSFSWRDALLGRYDVFHVHWPEILVNGRTRMRKAVRQLLFLAFLCRLRVTGTPIIRTVHNLAKPQGISFVESRLLDLVERMTTYRLVLNSTTELGAGQDHSLVKHGHYKNWFESYDKPAAVLGRLCYFGLIRRYKAVDTLIQAFREISPEEPLSLYIAGSPSSEELSQTLTELASGDERISMSLRFQSEAELAAAVSESELVILPYREMHNSGGVLAALSLQRPVLVPDNEANRALAQEVGPGWVYTYGGKLTGDRILATLEEVRSSTGSPGPDLSARSWEAAGKAHLEAYSRAVESKRRTHRRYSSNL
jgi:beta-1,4-mannosyltransferase